MIASKEQLQSALERGAKLRLELRHEPEFKKIWSVAGTGEAVHGAVAGRFERGGKLQPLQDGLFEDAASQTFELAK